MKKTISGVLLALTAVFTLVACGKKKTTTAQGGDTTAKKETTKKKTTTKLTSKQKIEMTNKLSFHCWNTEFKERVDKFYANTNYYDATTTYLTDGTYIEWTVNANEGSNYQDKLDTALGKNEVDMFVFEADYASKYVKSDKVADLSQISGLDMSKQYKYTKDIVTLGDEIKGTSWQACPGVTIVNMNVADAVWGTWEKKDGKETLKTAAKLEDVAAKIGPEGDFEAAAAEVKAAKKNKFMMIGPDDWYRVYSQNLANKMWDGTNLTVAPEIFDWVEDTMDFYNKRYIRSVDDDYGLWGAEWGAEQGKDNCLCIFSVPWFTDFCLKGYRYADGDDPDNMGVKEMKNVNLKVCASHKGWFWGGTWLTATKTGLANDKIKGSIEDIIKKMTTDTDTLVAISKGVGDFTNSEAAMENLAKSDDMKLDYFGGQNAFAIYAESIKTADMSKASDYDQQVNEGMQGAFKQYFQGFLSFDDAWADAIDRISKASGVGKDNIKKGVAPAPAVE